MAKNKPYANVPMYIVFRGSRAFNTHTGQYLTSKQLEAYTSPRAVITEHKLSHDQILEKRWDLRLD